MSEASHEVSAKSESRRPAGQQLGQAATEEAVPALPTARTIRFLQRTAGNRAVARLLRPRADHALPHPPPGGLALLSAALQRDGAPSVQRDGGEAVDHDQAKLKAVQLVNKNSLLKIKLPVKPPTNVKLWKGLELKKVELEVDVTAELDVPTLSGKGPTKVSGGTQKTGASEVDSKKGSLTDTQATVYALEVQQKFSTLIPGEIGNALSFKAGAEYGEYKGENALTPAKAEAKGKVALALDTDLLSAEFAFTPLAYDRTKQGKDAFKLGVVTVKFGTGKILEKKLPGAIVIQATPVDVKARLKISGSVDVGPDTDALGAAIAKKLGKAAAKDFAAAAAPQVVEEESRRFAQNFAKEVAEEQCRHIADAKEREAARIIAQRKIEQEIASRQFEHAVAKEASIFVQQAVEKSAPLDVISLRAMATEIVQKVARPAVAELLPALRLMAREAIEQLSVRGIATNIAKAMAGGPADFVLVGAEIIYHSIETAIMDIELKEVGLKAQTMRDNYVAGYSSALKGKASGAGQGGGQDNLPGAAYLLGVSEGTQQFDTIVAQHLTLQPGTDRQRVVEDVRTIMESTPVETTSIVEKASPKLKEMLLSAFEKNHTGILDRIFGSDVRGTKDFKLFQQMVEHHLAATASRTTVARLANGVFITLVMLDSTGDRAQVFRTQDGKHIVTLTGDTTKHSGWVTQEGRPLEEVYTSQQAAEETGAGDEARIEEQKKRLAACTLTADVRVGKGVPFRLLGVRLGGGPSDPRFDEFLRSAAAQALSVGATGAKTEVSGWFLLKQRNVQFSATVTGGAVHVHYGNIKDSPGFADFAGEAYPTQDPERLSTGAVVADLYQRHIAPRTLASLPELV